MRKKGQNMRNMNGWLWKSKGQQHILWLMAPIVSSPVSHSPLPILSVSSPVFACTTSPLFSFLQAQMPCFYSSPVFFLSVSSSSPSFSLLIGFFSTSFYLLKCRSKRYNFSLCFTLFLYY